MKGRYVGVIVTAVAFLLGVTVFAEARCGGGKQKGCRHASSAYQSQTGGSCCSSGSPAQSSSGTGSSCCSKGVQNVTVAKEILETKNQSACKFCGMNRQQFAKSRMLVEYEGLPPQAICSLHCAAVEIASASSRRPTSIMVGDFVTMEMIDAEKAHWVIGGSKTGVMTKTGTWAFNQKGDAEKFFRENGGKIGDFVEALGAVYDDMKDNIIRTRQ